MNIIKETQEIIIKEAHAILSLIPQIDDNFFKAIELMLACEGKIIVIGLGKSGIIGDKMTATLSSTGTPSIYLHATEALHGSLGIVQKQDIVILISNSGETKEALRLVEYFNYEKIKNIAITGNIESTLAKKASVAITISTPENVCPLGLAPMASTTAMLVLSDALAVVLMKLKGFKKEDFAKVHPGGNLGRILR